MPIKDRLFAPILALLLPFISFAQTSIKSSSPFAVVDVKRHLYYGIDNPVLISPGNIIPLHAVVTNGTLKSTNQQGRFFIQPTGKNYEPVLLTLTGKNYKKVIKFDVSYLALNPEIDITGPRNDDNMIENFKTTSGLYVYHKPMDIDIKYNVDSFRIEVKDSVSTRSHMNVGASWDSTSLSILRAMSYPIRIMISDAHLSLPSGKRIRSSSFREFYYRRS